MKKRFWIAVYFLLFISLGIIFGTCYWCKLSLNLTPSMPLGIWHQVGQADISVVKGAVISICPPDTALFRDARAQGILRVGSCPGEFAPLLKRVVGVPGDVVEVGDAVKVNGKIMRHSLVIKEVAAFYKIKHSLKKLTHGELLVMGDTDDSFDSRYFGVIAPSGLISVQHLVF